MVMHDGSRASQSCNATETAMAMGTRGPSARPRGPCFALARDRQRFSVVCVVVDRLYPLIAAHRRLVLRSAGEDDPVAAVASGMKEGDAEWWAQLQRRARLDRHVRVDAAIITGDANLLFPGTPLILPSEDGDESSKVR